MKKVYQTLLAFNSIMLFFVVYLVKSHSTILPFSETINHLIYVLAILLYAQICLAITKLLPEEIIEGGIIGVELADGSYLPSYLGYFFVALSVNDLNTLVFVGVIIFVLSYHSQTLYFNPLFLIYSYKFYYVTVDNGMRFFIITNREIKSIEGISFNDLRRINDYTFIERRKRK